ncbi:amino acid permease [Streptomyces sp. NPDC050121]|uniref:amino acid permease n=1 Tax=Streptomyces sp. NPDC050121 TaxID=3365601 RepID=UPI003794BCE8
MRSEELHETLLPKRLALPIFASDPLSSVAYATQEILLVLRYLVGDAPVAESAKYGIAAEPGDAHLAGLALVMLVLRAFSQGCTALTGVEAISNGVPAFRKPKPKNAATTMAVMGAISITMFIGVTTLALISKVRVTDDSCRLTGLDGSCESYTQRTVIAQIAAAVFGGEHSIGFYFIQAATALILILAANTAFNGFPLLASILAQHRYLPRQLHNRGDRLAFSNGILALAIVAGLLLWGFKANVTQLIHLYILGVFTSFTLSQTGMVRHWNRELRTETDPAARRSHKIARVINGTGAVVTGLVLLIVLATKFTQGAWLAVVAATVLWVMMRGIRRHYDATAAELAVTDPRDQLVPPSRVFGIVLVSTIHKPTLRALSYARAFRPDQLEALTVSVDRDEAAALRTRWEEYGIEVPLKILDSPYREVTKPVVEYVRSIRRESPRDVVAVFIPEYVVGHWWENLLHNQSALWLKSRLLFTPGVMVTSVPWQLTSSAHADRPAARAPGSVRRGEPPTVAESQEQPTGSPRS